MSAFGRTGPGEWTYLGFRVRRHKGDRFTYRTRVCKADAGSGSRVVTLSAPSLAELKWQIDRSVAEGGVPPDMDRSGEG